ncbi:type I-E CRISPR-associated protein Cas6/Cse3/CasE [Corynebacterium vitaeruminis]|uniref:type I-E CRISPR-associated protein Cas6/Cse3/CasE n=1 Tax=Corynebacterium vitaeruminis TaxID=38305 RepID=UPI0023F48545|nr:type I-E CRISPR-associated protein Cas6/Cse3/CasE [Corynebacterium vitaeruminis]
MLLTTITLNKPGQGLVHDAQAVHRTLKYLDPNVLWGCPDGLHLIIQHTHSIDWMTGLGRVMRMAHTTYAHQPDVGDTVDIALIGNPTLCQPRPGQRRGKRVPAPPDKWMGWLHKRLDPCLTIHHVEATKLTPARGQKPTMRTTTQRVLYTATATVTDPDMLDQLKTSGVGQGKAYGCGLLITQEVTK